LECLFPIRSTQSPLNLDKSSGTASRFSKLAIFPCPLVAFTPEDFITGLAAATDKVFTEIWITLAILAGFHFRPPLLRVNDAPIH